MSTEAPLVEHFFRHEYGKVVSTLSRRVGVVHLQLVEDAVQDALARALETWKTGNIPESPSAWIYRVAHNELLDEFRRSSRQNRLVQQQLEGALDRGAGYPPTFFEHEVKDDLLRMIFVCCDDALPQSSRLVLALKTLCGFSVREIGQRLFLSDANVYKRLARGRKKLAENARALDDLTSAQYAARLPAVHQVLYLVFTEGYLSSHAEHAIRGELCREAIRLTLIVAKHVTGETPQTFALLAVMHLHAARISSRQDGSGGLLLLEEQDRSLWDQAMIGAGLKWLERSAQGPDFSRYHAEAGIAAAHCLARTTSETRWDNIVECYALLNTVAPSALHRLNQAVALAEWKGVDAGLESLVGFVPPTWLQGSYLWSAVLDDLHLRRGDKDVGEKHRRASLQSAPSAAIRTLLERRLRRSGLTPSA